MPIKLIAIDIYGTLVGPGGHGRLPDENLTAIQQALDHDVIVAFVTGLNRASALEILDQSQIPRRSGLMMACYNGAVMFDLHNEEVVWELSHPSDLTRQLIDHPAVAPHFPMVHGPFDLRNLMWIQQGDHPEILSRYLEQRANILGSNTIRIVDNLVESIDFSAQIIGMLAPEEAVHHAADEISKQIRIVAALEITIIVFLLIQ